MKQVLVSAKNKEIKRVSLKNNIANNYTKKGNKFESNKCLLNSN